MNKTFHLSYLLIIAVLVALLCLSLNKDKKVEVVERRVTDTLCITLVDTIYERYIEYIEKKTIDTLYLSNDIKLPIEQKHYQNNGVYDAWVSGYQPQLDSIITYPKTIYQTITNETIREIEIKRWNFYTYMGFNYFCNTWNPSVGIMAKSAKNTTMYGFEVGLIDKSAYLGFKFGYNIR